MKNKKTIMAVSALLILIFHLWANITQSGFEIFLKQICVIGVDMFFFISAYSISKKKEIKYKEFILNRFNNIYFKFFILAIIALIYSKWKFSKFFKTILGIDLFLSGGGSFLWFLPGIMFIYLLFPFFIKVDKKYPLITPIVGLIFFLIFTVCVSMFTNYNAIFILTNRLPILLLGYYFGKYNVVEMLDKNKVLCWFIIVSLLIVGNFISYYSIMNRVRLSWFYDVFYILNIPLEIGLILFLNKIKDNKLSTIIGSCTLELYGLQMIFGFKIANTFYKMFNKPLLCNVSTILLLIIISLMLKFIFDIKDNVLKRKTSKIK